MSGKENEKSHLVTTSGVTPSVTAHTLGGGAVGASAGTVNSQEMGGGTTSGSVTPTS